MQARSWRWAHGRWGGRRGAGVWWSAQRTTVRPSGATGLPWCWPFLARGVVLEDLSSLAASLDLTHSLYLGRVGCVADRPFSAQTLSLLNALEQDPAVWRHGYELAKETGLQSGTLYPVLIRLADRGLVQACWEDQQPAGRPRRHLYRLTPDGLAVARAALSEVRSQRHRSAVPVARQPARAKGA